MHILPLSYLCDVARSMFRGLPSYNLYPPRVFAVVLGQAMDGLANFSPSLARRAANQAELASIDDSLPVGLILVKA